MYTNTFISNKKKIILGCIFLIISSVLFAQKNELNRVVTNKWSININAGSTQFWGYINPKNLNTSLKHIPMWGYGLALTRQITPEFEIRGQFLMGKLRGKNDFSNDGKPINLLYFSDFTEGNISAKFSLTDMINGYKPNRPLTIYGLAGLGVANFQGETIDYLTFEKVHNYGHGSGRGIFGYEIEGLGTFGIGLTLKLSKVLDFTFENSLKFTNTNKLNETKGILQFDSYGYSSIGLSYNFSLNKDEKKVPVVKNNIPEKQKSVEVKKEVVNTPVKTEQKVTPAQTMKQPEIKEEGTKQVEKIALFSGYKIQILATLTYESIDNIMQQYKLTERIREDHSDKWYRYSVGEFKTFSEAKAYRKNLKKHVKLKDSFIVKFEDGKRVGQVWK